MCKMHKFRKPEIHFYIFGFLQPSVDNSILEAAHSVAGCKLIQLKQKTIVGQKQKAANLIIINQRKELNMGIMKG